MTDWIPVLVGVYVGVSLVSHILQFVLWWRYGERLAIQEARMEQGLHYANLHTNNSIAALRNGTTHG